MFKAVLLYFSYSVAINFIGGGNILFDRSMCENIIVVQFVPVI